MNSYLYGLNLPSEVKNSCLDIRYKIKKSVSGCCLNKSNCYLFVRYY